MSVNLSVQKVPRWRVVVEQVPKNAGPMASPVVVSDSVVTLAVAGQIPITLPAVADGEAYMVTATPVW